jgi:oligopeptide/dipeptide ABC transporter ATP-binding protein
VETGATDELFTDPVHPYTRLLLGSVPRMLTRVHGARAEGTADPFAVVDGEPEADESPFAAHAIEGEGTGCRFRPRCPVAVAACAAEPDLLPLPDDPVRSAACWHAVERPSSAPLTTKGRAG